LFSVRKLTLAFAKRLNQTSDFISNEANRSYLTIRSNSEWHNTIRQRSGIELSGSLQYVTDAADLTTKKSAAPLTKRKGHHGGLSAAEQHLQLISRRGPGFVRASERPPAV